MTPPHAAEGTPSPHVIGRYALFDEIASGGMATVHLGRLAGSAGFSRTIAIKRLHPQFAKDPEFVTMFLDEARLASRIQHPNVVATLDVVAGDGEVFLVMEYVGGEALSKLLRNAFQNDGVQVRTDVAVSIVCDVLHGLHAAHEAKSETGEPLRIVHRDVSPQNVLVGLDGIARVLDFGVAKAALRAQSTREGQVKGKISYMSPEQLNAKDVDRRADVFAVGVIAWEILCGQRLFGGEDAGEIFGKLLQGNIQAPNDLLAAASKRMVPAGVNDAVMKALARDPAQRFATARDFAIALEHAIAVAPAHRVGEWVQQHAGPELKGRQSMVARIERYVFPVTDELTPNPISTVSPVSARLSDDATRRDVFSTRTPSAQEVDTVRPRSRQQKRRTALVWSALAGAGLAVVLWGVLSAAPSTQPEITPLPPKHPSLAETAGNEPVAKPAGSAVEPTQAEQGGAGGAGSAPTEPSETAAAGSASGDRAAGDEEPSPLSSAATPAKPAPKVFPSVSPRPARPKSDPCNPPWRIDERGIKRLKPGCY